MFSSGSRRWNYLVFHKHNNNIILSSRNILFSLFFILITTLQPLRCSLWPPGSVLNPRPGTTALENQCSAWTEKLKTIICLSVESINPPSAARALPSPPFTAPTQSCCRGKIPAWPADGAPVLRKQGRAAPPAAEGTSCGHTLGIAPQTHPDNTGHSRADGETLHADDRFHKNTGIDSIIIQSTGALGLT